MKQMSRIFLLLSITALLAGCKLAVIVVEGGEVQSTRSGTCMVGNICIVDVDDPNFSETFTAVPDTGWYFQRWNSGYKFFCGDSLIPTCALSFQGYEESEEVENMVASSEVFYLMPIFSQTKPITNTVTVNGKEWAQPKDFVNYSFDQVSAACPEGICSGTLPGSELDLTGYTWASLDDVSQLFNSYGVTPPFTELTGTDQFRQDQTVAAEAFLEDFEQTASDPYPRRELFAMAYGPTPSDSYVNLAYAGDTEFYITREFFRDLTPRGSIGIWLWRPATAAF